MIRTLVISNDSFVADEIASILAQEIDLQVLRFTHRERSQVEKAIRDECSVVIIVEEVVSDLDYITASELVRNNNCLLIVTISAGNNHIHICDCYQVQNPKMAQVIDLVRTTRDCRLHRDN